MLFLNCDAKVQQFSVKKTFSHFFLEKTNIILRNTVVLSIQNEEKILRIPSPLAPSYEEGETVTFILTHKNEEGTSLLEKRYNSHLIRIGKTENNINVPESSDIATSDCDLEVPDFGRLEVKVGVNNILTYNRVLSVEEMRNMPKENQDF